MFIVVATVKTAERWFGGRDRNSALGCDGGCVMIIRGPTTKD
jgi:hypothetical protein